MIRKPYYLLYTHVMATYSKLRNSNPVSGVGDLQTVYTELRCRNMFEDFLEFQEDGIKFMEASLRPSAASAIPHQRRRR